MPLVLSLKEGDDFYADDRRFVLTETVTDAHVRIERYDGKVFDVVSDKAVAVDKDVACSVGKPVLAGVTRLAIDAPKSVRLASGKNYRG